MLRGVLGNRQQGENYDFLRGNAPASRSKWLSKCKGQCRRSLLGDRGASSVQQCETSGHCPGSTSRFEKTINTNNKCV